MITFLTLYIPSQSHYESTKSIDFLSGKNQKWADESVKKLAYWSDEKTKGGAIIPICDGAGN